MILAAHKTVKFEIRRQTHDDPDQLSYTLETRWGGVGGGRWLGLKSVVSKSQARDTIFPFRELPSKADAAQLQRRMN